MSDATKLDEVRDLNSRLRGMAEFQAVETAKELQALVREKGLRFLRSAEGLKFLAYTLKPRAAEILKMGAVIAITDGPIRRKMASSHPKLAGKRSGESRAKTGAKARFLDWALAAHRQNPVQSKNDLAERFAATHPGTSRATLRRYLAAVPVVDWDRVD